jgi:hypothetical protein
MNWLGLNWIAVLCAGAAGWVLAAVWYSMLFGKIWAREQERHLGRPCGAGRSMPLMLVSTFVLNVMMATAMAYLIKRTGFADMNHAIKLAVATGIGFAGTALTIVSVWEGKPTKVWLIDTSYYLVSAIVLAAILISWP